MIDRDKFNAVNPRLVGNAACAVIDAVQSLPPEERSLGMAAAFLFLCEEYRIRPNETFLVVQNILNDVGGPRPEMRAVKQYLAQEMHS